MKKSIFLAIVLFLICIFSGAINWVFQFIVVGLCYFLSGVYLAYQTHKTNKKWLLFLLCLPFIILYSIISIHNTLSNDFYATMPIWIGAIFYGLLGYIVYQKGLRPKGIIVTGIVTAFLNFIFIHNWFAGDTTSFTITLKNNGMLPYKINGILASCGCLEIEYDPNQKILPEETLDIPVDFIAKRQGLFHKTITIKGNTKPSFTIFNFFGEVSGNKINQ
jgi:uncharacterized membrane protein HdeD (DUF308 family)